MLIFAFVRFLNSRNAAMYLSAARYKSSMDASPRPKACFVSVKLWRNSIGVMSHRIAYFVDIFNSLLFQMTQHDNLGYLGYLG